MIEKMWEILNTLTEDAQKAVLAKCKELGLDPNKGDIPLDESFINLDAARRILMDAIKKRKLVQLPLTVQKTLLSQLETIARLQTELTGGTDHVVNLVSAIEALHFTMWQYRLPNLSDEVLGFETKMNQLKSLDLDATRLKGELESGLALKVDLQKLLEEAKQRTDTLQKSVVTSEETVKKVNDDLASTTAANQKAAALLTTIQQYDTTSTQLLSATKTSNAEVTALEPKIKDFYKEIDQYRGEITSTTKDAQGTIQANKEQTEALIAELKRLEDQIKTQIEKATGYSLFQSFQKRKETLVWSKRLWALALFVLALASIILSKYIIDTTAGIDVAFFLKLSMSIPILYAIGFCTIQYNRERKLEEEYAFKSNISVSLVPYQEFVGKLVDKSQTADREKYATFIIDAITKVFTSPTEKIFESGDKQKGFDKAVKQVLSALEPLLKVLKH